MKAAGWLRFATVTRNGASKTFTEWPAGKHFLMHKALRCQAKQAIQGLARDLLKPTYNKQGYSVRFQELS